MKNEVKIALNICTFQREEFIHRNLSLLQASDFSIRTTRSITEGFIFLWWTMAAVCNCRRVRMCIVFITGIQEVLVDFREELRRSVNEMRDLPMSFLWMMMLPLTSAAFICCLIFIRGRGGGQGPPGSGTHVLHG